MSTDLTIPQLNDRLAEAMGAKQQFVAPPLDPSGYFVEHWVFPSGLVIARMKWSPCEDRNHLAIVMEWCEREEILHEVSRTLYCVWFNDVGRRHDAFDYFLTVSPEVVARAVVEVIDQKKARA